MSKYKVAVVGLMKKNGQVAKFGEELTDGVHIEDAEKKVKQGYLLPSDEFDKKAKADEAAAKEAKEVADLKADQKKKDEAGNGKPVESDEEKAKREEKEEADRKKKAEEAATKNREKLFVAYKKKFKADAPADASDEELDKAIKDNVIIPALT